MDCKSLWSRWKDAWINWKVDRCPQLQNQLQHRQNQVNPHGFLFENCFNFFIVAPADDDDVDLFGSEDEDEEAEKIKEDRVKAYAEKKSKKPVLIAKSSILLDVKPWDDETDMAEMEKQVRSVIMDGLLWGASKLVPLAYGIKKLQICCVIEDDKVSVDELQEKIQEFEDFVQSVDIAAFNKI